MGAVGLANWFHGRGAVFTDPMYGQITISGYYNRNLDDNGMKSLYDTIAHESFHRTKGAADMLRRSFMHDDIYAEAAKRT